MEQNGIFTQRFTSHETFPGTTRHVLPAASSAIFSTTNGYEWRSPLVCILDALETPLTFFRLLSQSIFLVQVDSYDREGNRQTSKSVSGCGISGLSFVALCVTFYIFVFGVGLVGRRRLKLQIPFAGSCSLIVSAACHAPLEDNEPHLRQVQWGVVEKRMFDGEQHCSFSSDPVGTPEDGVRYR